MYEKLESRSSHHSRGAAFVGNHGKRRKQQKTQKPPTPHTQTPPPKPTPTPLVYKDIGNDPALLYANMEKKNAAVVSFLENNGIEKEEISIAPPEVIDMQAERYVDRNVAYRYNATSVITVTSKNVDRVRKLMSGQAELLKQGIAITGGDYKYNVSYEFTGLNEVKPRMIEEATKNARAAAEKFAKDSDSELGKIRNASQGQFSISDRDAYTPYIKSVRVVTTVNYYLKK